MLSMALCIAVMAALGGDDLLCPMHGAAVAGQSRLVCQSELFMAWSYAHAGEQLVLCFVSKLKLLLLGSGL